MVGFFRTILIIIIIMYALKLIGRYIIPLLIKRQVKKFQQESGNYQQENNRKEGEIHVNKNKQTKKNNSSEDNSEYVDYEEVE